MNTNYKIAGCLLALVIAFASGRYSVQAPEVHTVVDQKTDTKQAEQQDTHTQTKIVEHKLPTGEVTTTTTITQVQDTEEETQQVAEVHVDQTVTPPKIDTLHLNVLVGEDIRNIGQPVYGIQVTKKLIGPVEIGAFGFTNSLVGVSIGISF